MGEKGGTSVCLGGINMRGGGKKIKKGDRKRQPTFSLLESVLRAKKGENKYMCKGMVDPGFSSDPKNTKATKTRKTVEPIFRGGGQERSR